MSTRSVQFAENEFYHVYNRGVEKRVIYTDQWDYSRFLELLYLSNSVQSVNVRDIKKVHTNAFEYDRGDSLVAIGAFCLMPNHFHILLTPTVEGGVSTFLNKLTTSYSMYFNKKYNRSGRLFEGSFKSQHAESDEYLKYLFSYIHLNPVKLIEPAWREQGVKDVGRVWEYIHTYPYSSLLGYSTATGDMAAGAIIDPESFPEYFQTGIHHKEELFDWLEYESYP